MLLHKTRAGRLWTLRASSALLSPRGINTNQDLNRDFFLLLLLFISTLTHIVIIKDQTSQAPHPFYAPLDTRPPPTRSKLVGPLSLSNNIFSFLFFSLRISCLFSWTDCAVIYQHAGIAHQQLNPPTFCGFEKSDDKWIIDYGGGELMDDADVVVRVRPTVSIFIAFAYAPNLVINESIFNAHKLSWGLKLAVSLVTVVAILCATKGSIYYTGTRFIYYASRCQRFNRDRLEENGGSLLHCLWIIYDDKKTKEEKE